MISKRNSKKKWTGYAALSTVAFTAMIGTPAMIADAAIVFSGSTTVQGELRITTPTQLTDLTTGGALNNATVILEPTIPGSNFNLTGINPRNLVIGNNNVGALTISPGQNLTVTLTGGVPRPTVVGSGLVTFVSPDEAPTIIGTVATDGVVNSAEKLGVVTVQASSALVNGTFYLVPSDTAKTASAIQAAAIASALITAGAVTLDVDETKINDNQSYVVYAIRTNGEISNPSHTAFSADLTAPTAPNMPMSSKASGGWNFSEVISGVPVSTGGLYGTGAKVGDKVQFLVDGNLVIAPDLIISSPTQMDGVTLTLYPGNLGADGFKSITTRVVDAAGNIGAGSPPLVVNMDTTPPNAAVTSAGFTVALDKTANTITLTQAGAFETGLTIDPTKITIDAADDDNTTPNVALDADSIASVTSNANSVVITLNDAGQANVDSILSAFGVTKSASIDFADGWLMDAAGNRSLASASGTTPKTQVTVTP